MILRSFKYLMPNCDSLYQEIQELIMLKNFISLMKITYFSLLEIH